MFFMLVFLKLMLFFMFFLILMFFMLFLNLNLNLMIILKELFFHSNENLIFFFDLYTFMFLLTIMLVVMNVFEFMNFYMMGSKNMILFMFFVLMFIFSMLLLVCSMNLLSMIFGWEGLGFSSFYLIFFYNNFESWKSSLKTLINNKIGDSFIMMSLIYMILFNSNMYMTFFFFFCILTKSAQYPFMSWLPMAMSAPTPISSMVHSSTLVTAGLYITYRYLNFFLMFFNLNIFMNISLISMFISGLKSLMEKDMKKVVALSTLSQVSMILFMSLINFKTLSFIYMCNHAFFKSILFMNLGFSMLNNFMNQNFFNSKVLILNSMFNLSMKISLFNLMNLSFFSSFFVKEVFINLIYFSSYNLMNMMFFYLSTFFTMIYSFNLLIHSFSLNFNLSFSMNLSFKNSMILLFLTNMFSMLFNKMILYLYMFNLNDNLILMLFYIIMLMMLNYLNKLNLKVCFFLMYLNYLLYSFPMKKMIKSLNFVTMWMEMVFFYYFFLLNIKKKNLMSLSVLMMVFMFIMLIY